MKKIFKQHLHDFLYYIISTRNWKMDWSCENELNHLIELSVDRISHSDCTKDEMVKFAKLNLSHLLNQMYLDSKKRHSGYLDAASVYNVLAACTCLWPFKTMEAAKSTLAIPVSKPTNARQVH